MSSSSLKPYQNLSLMDMEGEEWKDIIGYDGIYQVSNMGRVKSLQRYDSLGRLRKERILKQFGKKTGLTISLQYTGEKCKSVHVTSIIGEAFLGLRQKGECFCHLDKMQTNNLLSNIIKTTYSNSILLDYKLNVKSKINKGTPKYLYKSELGNFLFKELVLKYGKSQAYSITQSIKNNWKSLGVKWERIKIINL